MNQINQNLLAALAANVDKETFKNVVKTAAAKVAAEENVDEMCAIEKWQTLVNNYDVKKIASESKEGEEKIMKLAAEAQEEMLIAKIADVTSDIVIHKLQKIASAKKEASEAAKTSASLNKILS